MLEDLLSKVLKLGFRGDLVPSSQLESAELYGTLVSQIKSHIGAQKHVKYSSKRYKYL